MTSVIVKSEVRRKVIDLNVSSDVFDKIEEVVIELIKKAEVRAKANGRKTVYARDF